MLRLTDIKLDLNHQPEELRQAVLDKLNIVLSNLSILAFLSVVMMPVKIT